MKIPGYGKVWNLGHPEVRNIFEYPVVLQEKVDGSQFSFMKDEQGEVHFRSKNTTVYPGDGGMFGAGVQAILAVANQIPVGYIFRAEYLRTPRHNTLGYDRVPQHHVIVFDVQTPDGDFIDPSTIEHPFEVVPCYSPPGALVITSYEELDNLLEGTSCLGGPIEGVVIKAYGHHDTMGHMLKAKYVRPAFREMNHASSPARKTPQKDILTTLAERFYSEARFEKALYRLRDEGRLTNSPKDIGALLGEVARDADEELEAAVKEALWKWAKKGLMRSLQRGLPEWYKTRLLTQQFEQ